MSFSLGGFSSPLAVGGSPFPTSRQSSGFVSAPGDGSGSTIGQVEDATGTIAGIVGNIREIWGGGGSAGGEPRAPATTQAGDPEYGGTEPRSSTDSLGDSLKRTIENIWSSAKTTAEAAVRGAATSAEATSAGARQGATFGASGSNPVNILLIGGVLVAVLLLRK